VDPIRQSLTAEALLRQIVYDAHRFSFEASGEFRKIDVNAYNVRGVGHLLRYPAYRFQFGP
jgi:hypothetical protein